MKYINTNTTDFPMFYIESNPQVCDLWCIISNKIEWERTKHLDLRTYSERS